MALRTLVTGSDMCSGSDGAGPSNAVGALVNQLLGGAAKTQEQLRDVRCRGAGAMRACRHSATQGLLPGSKHTALPPVGRGRDT
jgi:hypothetical protein